MNDMRICPSIVVPSGTKASRVVTTTMVGKQHQHAGIRRSLGGVEHVVLKCQPKCFPEHGTTNHAITSQSSAFACHQR